MNTENSKTSKSHKFVLNLTQKLDLRSWNKQTYCTSKLVYLLRLERYKTTVHERTINLKLQVQRGMISFNYQMIGYIEYIIKTMRYYQLIDPPIHIQINRINNRLVFIKEDGYKLELKTPETMKLFGSTKKINRQNKEWRK